MILRFRYFNGTKSEHEVEETVDRVDNKIRRIYTFKDLRSVHQELYDQNCAISCMTIEEDDNGNA